MINTLLVGNCLEKIEDISSNSVDAVITDPPYGLDKLDENWNDDEVQSKKNMQTVTSLPSGMKFDASQGKKFYTFYLEVSKKLLRVLKPGGYFFSFSSPRLYHNLCSAVEDAGFLIKDQFIWLYTQNQPKAMSLNHFIKKLNLPEQEKIKLAETLSGWKTPQVKSCHEPICVAQKPPEGTFLQNFIKHEVGLFDTNVKIGKDQDMFVANVLCDEASEDILTKYFLVSKPKKSEKGDFNIHKTVKPLDICSFLISLCTREGQLVLDPFCGSGTTCVAAKMTNRNYIGIDNVEKYINITKERLKT